MSDSQDYEGVYITGVVFCCMGCGALVDPAMVARHDDFHEEFQL